MVLCFITLCAAVRGYVLNVGGVAGVCTEQCLLLV